MKYLRWKWHWIKNVIEKIACVPWMHWLWVYCILRDFYASEGTQGAYVRAGLNIKSNIGTCYLWNRQSSVGCVFTPGLSSSKLQRTELWRELGCVMMIRCHKALNPQDDSTISAKVHTRGEATVKWQRQACRLAVMLGEDIKTLGRPPFE